MNQIDEKQKEAFSVMFALAMENEKLSRDDAAKILKTSASVISWIRNPKYWKMVPLAVWNEIKLWVESKEKLTEYRNIVVKETLESKYHNMPEGTFDITNSHTTPILTQVPSGMKYEIEHGIPIPPKSVYSAVIYPFDAMEIGDSFKVPIVLKTPPKRVYGRISTAIDKYRKTHPNIRFTLRTLRKEECVRCWRIK